MVLGEKAQPEGERPLFTTNADPAVLPKAAAAARHTASVSIRTEPAGHALLPAAPDTYAPAHDSTAGGALGRAAATAAEASVRAIPREYPVLPNQYSGAPCSECLRRRKRATRVKPDRRLGVLTGVLWDTHMGTLGYSQGYSQLG